MTDPVSISQIPKGVYVRNGRYYRVLQNKWLALTRVDEGLVALRRSLRELLVETGNIQPRTVSDLLALYLPAAEISDATRREYERIVDTRLIQHFGPMHVSKVSPMNVAMYKEKRKRDGHGPMGNRETAVLSGAYDYAMRNGWAAFNPCRGVRRNKEVPRDRYVTDDEFRDAFNRAPIPLQDIMAIALLTGARQGELRALRRADIRPDGLHVHEGKTRKLRIVRWTDALKFFVDRALARQDEIAARPADPRRHRQARGVSDFILTNKFGEPWTLSGLQTAFKRLEVDWHFHDIRAKTQSDSKNKNVLGHAAGMLGVYARRQHVDALR
jgi:integrase